MTVRKPNFVYRNKMVQQREANSRSGCVNFGSHNGYHDHREKLDTKNFLRTKNPSDFRNQHPKACVTFGTSLVYWQEFSTNLLYIVRACFRVHPQRLQQTLVKTQGQRMWIIQNMEKSWSQAFVNATQGMFSPRDLQKSVCFAVYCDFTASEISIFQKKFQVDDGTTLLQKTSEMLELPHCIEPEIYSKNLNFEVTILLGWWKNHPSKWYQLEDFTYHPAENSRLQVNPHFCQNILLTFFGAFLQWWWGISSCNSACALAHDCYSHRSR
jgi:hypothetical protein